MTENRARIEILVNRLGPWPVPESLLAEGCRAVFISEGIIEGEVSVTLVGDEEIQGLNLQYLGKDHPTDVLAFALQAPGDPVLGDIYIGYEQALRQASELGVPLEEELLRLAVHGALHVLGYRHPEGEDRAVSEMFRRQEELVTETLRSAPARPS